MKHVPLVLFGVLAALFVVPVVAAALVMAWDLLQRDPINALLAAVILTLLWQLLE